MPKLKAYTSDSAKSGHYILANVGGSHPITIQVTDLGEQILRKAGYETGDNVPTKVVWSMFDIGILYTSGTINDPPEIVDGPDETFRQLGVANKLTAQEQDQLLRYLEEYTGPNQTEVNALRETLEQSDAVTQGETSLPKDVRDDLDRLSNLYERGDLMEEEYQLLKSRILDDLQSTAASQGDSGGASDPESWQKELRFDLAQEMRNIVPDDKYDNSHQNVGFEDRSTDDFEIVSVSYLPNEGGFTYFCSFHQRAHEDRMFELLEDNKWKLVNDDSNDSFLPNVMVRRPSSPDGFRDELPRGFVNNEIPHLLELIQTVYRTNLSDLALTD